jgi:predicted nucleic acid-binding protein
VIVVSDSSPLITLARAHHLELLREFYGQVLITREVHEEVTAVGAGLPGADEVRRASWIEVRSDPGEGVGSSIESACAGMGAGQRSVIYLASGLKAAVVLIDEDRARRVAKNLGLAVVGSIAVLERGAQLKKVPDLRSVIWTFSIKGYGSAQIFWSRALLGAGLAS